MNYLLAFIFLLFSSLALTQNDTQKASIQKMSRLDLVVISIDSHCDTVGSVDYNDRLALRRLDQVVGLLEIKEIQERKIIGEKEAANTKQYVADNFRRVDVVYRAKREKIENAEEPIEKIVDNGTDNLPENNEVEKITSSFASFLEDTTTNHQIIQTSILFYNRSVQYLPVSEPELAALCIFLQDNPNVKAHIRGHICCNPFMKWDDISEGRAKTVYQYLRSCSISDNRLTYKGYGTSLPFRSPEISEEDQRLNRRVDIIFSKE